MGFHRPVSLCGIIHQTHMEDIQGSWGSWYGFMTTNAMISCPDVLIIANLFIQMLSQIGMAWLPWGHHHPVSLCGIIHLTHMKDIQGSGGSWYGFMTTNAMISCPDVLISANLISQLLSQNWHGLAFMGSH
jgi:hypothetical protein